MPVTVGEAAPAFTLPDAEGRPVSLSDFAGQHVILYFYPEDGTIGCRIEACAFRDVWSELRNAGAVILGVSPDDGDSHRRFAEEFSLPFPLLCDVEHEVLETYDAWGEIPWGDGTKIGAVRSTVWIGPDGTVLRHWPKVTDAEGHVAEVAEAIRAGSG